MKIQKENVCFSFYCDEQNNLVDISDSLKTCILLFFQFCHDFNSDWFQQWEKLLMKLMSCYNFINRTDFIIIMYIYWIWIKKKFQINSVILNNVLIWFFIFCMILFKWLFQLNHESSQISSIHADFSDFFSMFFNYMKAFILNLFFLEKCIRI